MLINKKQTRRYVLQWCESRRPRFTRVSGKYLESLEASLKVMIDSQLRSLPSVGKTVK